MSNDREGLASQVELLQTLNNRRTELEGLKARLQQLGRHDDSPEATQLRADIVALEAQIAADEANTTSIRDTARGYHVNPNSQMVDGEHDV
ncbi:MAG TPA: hypothetical protein VLI05_04795 [Candidatus Saccharimonadia bacterium]|nr:hypothetical protein [Candidatus Saccharimonadia bacterium]